MARSFRSALMEAWDPKQVSAPELSRRSGVSVDTINKLKYRPTASTSAENASALARALGFEWSEAETPAGFAEPAGSSYARESLEALDRDPPQAGPVKPFEIQFSQVDGVVKVAAIIRDPEGFTKLRATLDALQALNSRT